MKLPACRSITVVFGLIFWGSQAIAQVAPPPPKPTLSKARAANPARNQRPVLPPVRRQLPKASSTETESRPRGGGTIEKIVIKGNKKIETDAIRAKLVSKEGSSYSEDIIRQDIQELFNTGFFYDVIVDRSEGANVVITYTLVEKPSILEIAFEGNDELEDDELKEAAAIKPYEILNQSKIREATEKLEKLYEDKGFFLARVSPKVTPIEGSTDTVKLSFIIKENDKVRVKRISFIGNKKLGASKLKSFMATQEGGFFSFISGSGAYKQEAFDRDVQLLQLVYFNEGYVQVKVDRPQVYVTPDKKGIYISIRVEEGEQFKVGSVDFTGDLLFSRTELFETTKIQEQEIFKYQTLQEDLKALQAKYGDLGYAYANPIPRTRIRDADREVDITFEIDKGQKVYIGKITAVGNSKTRDKVIRRELRIQEGELYNETRKRESMDNVKRLGFFEEVNFNTKTPRGRNDLMDIDVVVKERNTGTIQVGAGYSSFNGFVFNGQVNQINFLGKGQKLGVSIDVSKRNSLYKLSFTEPFFMDSEWSAGGDLYRSSRILREYTETKTGAAIRVGHPLAPYLDGYIRYKFDDTFLKIDKDNGDPDLFPVNTANGTTSSLTFSLIYDKRDDRFIPSKGIYGEGSIEYAGLGGSKSYTKGFGTFRYYKKLFWDLVWRNNLTYGFIRSNDPDKDPPFNELFLLGGANSLRGYEWFTVGKRKFSKKRYQEAITHPYPQEIAANKSMLPFGGTQQFYYNIELQFPLITEAGIRGVFFYDVGEAEDGLTLKNLRQDVGFGVRWFSPIGPLRFEWGFPLERDSRYDEPASNFEFAIGAPF